ncbi:hypothetical protein G7017_03745 [Pseudomonas fulva]|uniref:Uncharacterized protein n=1 Tax=Pseudomonas paracarnis TaxID=2750625 RepID=A0ABU6BRH6_9PSED|nr:MULTISPECIES: hypothetical protein [Pseudomonas]MBA1220016.1 hypothetical protein [Pseudomonas fulva]MDG9889216.1 hypothetical protein [Pseudomonas juntendi]MEB3782416.1 hypothetical protein [Pseudomonas paracarnis]
MKNLKSFRKWISDGNCEFYYVTTNIDKFEMAFAGSSEYEIVFETAGFPKDKLIIKFINKELVRVIVATEGAFLKSKYEITSDILDVNFISESLIEVKTCKFEFSMCKQV